MAFCGEPDPLDSRRDVLLNPGPIMEVLSDSTEACDRGDKSAFCRRFSTLKDYLPVSQTRAQAGVYTRGERGRWTLTSTRIRANRVPRTGVDFSLALVEVCDKVPLPARSNPPRSRREGWPSEGT